jgi:hypothetical protein
MEAVDKAMKTQKATQKRPGRQAQPAKVSPAASGPSSRGRGSSPAPPRSGEGAARAEGNEPSHSQIPLTRAHAIRELADRANRGSEEALARLRRLFDDCPEIWEQVGDLARHAELAWLDLVADEDRLIHESVKRHIAKMKDRLAGPHPTPMEQLLVNQAVACYLAVQHAETSLSAPGSCSPAQAAMRLRRAESAQRRYLSTLKTLARLRATVPQGLAPLKPLRLHTGDRQQARGAGNP